jgi:hypothetical protein
VTVPPAVILPSPEHALRRRLDDVTEDLQMEPEPGPASLDESSLLASLSTGNSAFSRPGLVARVVPFALVTVVAEASLALPRGTLVGTAVILSLVLLVAVALAFLLPWDRLPARATVLVPLAWTGWALALTLAAGTVSGVGLVLLIPLIWSVLFHRPWESACVVAAVVAAEITVSVVQSASDAVTVRRVVLWAALGGLLAHGSGRDFSPLRDKASRAGIAIEVGSAADGTRLAWSFPVHSGPPAAA